MELSTSSTTHILHVSPLCSGCSLLPVAGTSHSLEYRVKFFSDL